MTPQLKPLAVLLLVTNALGCRAWYLDNTPLVEPQDSRRSLELWVAGEHYNVHGLTVRNDTVFAVPKWEAPDCAECTLSYSLHQIDSVRVRRTSMKRTLLLAGGIAVLVLVPNWPQKTTP